MATATSRGVGSIGEGQHFLVHGLDWSSYRSVADAMGARRVRVTFDRGSLELVTLSPEHERLKAIFSRIVDLLAEEHAVPIVALGSTTFQREDLDRGFEPDECFYTANLGAILGKDRLDLEIDPPPDLTIEIDVTHRSLNRQGIYAAVGVPELWRFDGRTLLVFRLQEAGGYAACERSPTFPGIPLDGIARHALIGKDLDDASWKRLFRAWVRDQPRGL